MSIPLNIAEGRDRTQASADRIRFRGIARSSGMECGAILDVARLLAAIWSESSRCSARCREGEDEDGDEDEDEDEDGN